MRRGVEGRPQGLRGLAVARRRPSSRRVKDGLPLVKVGDPVYFEPLGVAFDKSGPDPSDMVTKVNEILDEMRADGTLKGFARSGSGLDLTVAPAS